MKIAELTDTFGVSSSNTQAVVHPSGTWSSTENGNARTSISTDAVGKQQDVGGTVLAAVAAMTVAPVITPSSKPVAAIRCAFWKKVVFRTYVRNKLILLKLFFIMLCNQSLIT